MKYLLIVMLLATTVFAQEKPETEKQKEVSAQFQKEVKELQDATEKLILPIEGQKYRLDEQIKQIQIDTQKKLNELQQKYAQLYKEADKK